MPKLTDAAVARSLCDS